MAPTKDQLEAENAALREQLAAAQAAPTAGTRPAPARPDYGLSEGERQDLEANGVTVSPFTGEQLNAHAEGVTPMTPEARRNADRARRPAESAPDVAPSPVPDGGDAGGDGN